MPVHPKCQKTFPDGNRAGHCAKCCETFIGNTSFEAHRVGDFPNGRRCEIQPYAGPLTESGNPSYGHWQDPAGNWRHGRKLTAEETAEVFASRNAQKTSKK